METANERTAHWGTCSNRDCVCAIVVYPHSDASHDLPDEDDWENSLFYVSCPICDSSMDWGGSDPASDIIRNY